MGDKRIDDPVYKQVKRILDDYSAWIDPPSDDVVKKIAFAATVAAHRVLEETRGDINHRAMFVLHEFTLERTGWRRWLYRWYHSDEPLRNDAARILKDSGCQFMRPIGSRSIAEDMSS